MTNACRMMWAAGTVAAMSSITFPAVSALVSRCTDHDQQGKTTPERGMKGQKDPQPSQRRLHQSLADNTQKKHSV